MDVFIVEDEGMIQELYVDILRMRGHRVFDIASTGEEAVERIRVTEDRPDLVIMDHRMPGMGGLDAARMMMDIDPSIKIILVSADDNAVWEALKLGIVGMRKPFNMGDLMSAIEVVVPNDLENGKGRSGHEVDPTIHRKGMYLVDERDGKVGIQLFKELLMSGYNGIVFTRKHPDTLSKEDPLKEVPVVWFTSTPMKGYTCISPMNIQKMLIMVQSSFSEAERSAIFVHGFEYVLSNLQFERVLNLMQVLNDRVMTSNENVIIFSLDTGVLDDRQLRSLEKELERIELST